MFIITKIAGIIPVILLAACPLPIAAQQNLPLQDSIRRLLVSHPNDTTRVNLLNKLAVTYNGKDSALVLAQSAAQLAEQLHYNTGKGNAILQSAIYYRIKGDYTTASEKALEAIHLLEESNTRGAADANIQLAQIYKDMSGANQTEEYLNRGIAHCQAAYKWASNNHDTAELVRSLNMAGVIYRDKGQVYGKVNYYDTAFDTYTKALDLINKSWKGTEMLGKLYNNISQIYTERKKDFNTGLSFLLKAVDYNMSHHNVSSLSFNYGNISSVYISLHDYPMALLYARKTLQLARQLGWPERLQNAYDQMYQASLAAGKTDSALKYYVLADRLDDSLTNISKMHQVMDLQTKYETAKKETEIARLQVEGSEKNKRIAQLAVALVLFAALAISMILLYRRVKHQQQQIVEQSGRLELMMKELHHRVKNNLQIVSSLLSLQAYKLQDEGAITVLRESQLRVQAMSFIHQRLYKKDALTAVNMKEYITDLAESLLSSYGFHRDAFDLQVTVKKEMLDIDKALPIGLIINEMVTNALKYAYPSIDRPSLSISLTENAHQLICLVKDNGIGIDEKDWKQKNSSFGKQLITALCRQLRADQTLVIDGGTQFTITIPKQAA